MTKHRGLCSLLATALLMTANPVPALARVYAPRVVAVGQPDPQSAITFLTHAAWKDLPAEERAEAIGKFLFDPANGLQVTAESPFAGTDPRSEHHLIRDPLQLWNVYGAASPEALSAAVAALWDVSGPGRAQVLFDPRTDRWAAAIPTGTGSRLFVPGGGEFIVAPDLQPRYSQGVAQYTRDLVLRRGETFTAWFNPQGDRWRLDPAWLKEKSQKARLLQPPAGPKILDDDRTAVRRGNGLFVYEPQLQGDAADFVDGVLTSRNLKITDAGLTLDSAGDGFVVFAVETPFVIVPELGDIADPKDDRGASVVEVDGAGLTAAWSPDAGATWISLETKEFPAKLDLTKEVAGRSGYLLRLNLKGKPGQAVVKSFRVSTWVQLAPGALPAIRPGENAFSLKTRDHDGLESLPLVVEANGPDENEFLKYAIRPPRELNPADSQRRAVGPFSLRIPARPGTQIAWLSVAASLSADSDESQTARLGLATDRPAGFVAQDLPRLPGDHNHWHYQFLSDVRLDQPAETVYLQLEGRPALNAYRIVAHCIPRETQPASRLQVTHRWREAGVEKESAHELEEGANYQVVAGDQIENVAVEYRVAGGRPPR